MLFPDARLVVFAKAPVPGQVKSRLIPHIGAAHATQLHRSMTTHTIKIATESDVCPVELWCSPDEGHEYFQELIHQFPITLFTQQGKDLGERMFNAAAHVLNRANEVVIIGSDCPQFTAKHLTDAFRLIGNDEIDAVVTPAYDGGYVLIGLNKVDQRLFDNISWGSSGVMQQTRNVLQDIGWRWEELPSLRDVDVEGDLEDIVANELQYPLSAELKSLLKKILAKA